VPQGRLLGAVDVRACTPTVAPDLVRRRTAAFLSGLALDVGEFARLLYRTYLQAKPSRTIS
jgi:hypothetical protein